MDKNKFNIIYSTFAKPISELAETYKNSHLTISNRLNNTKVAKCFDELIKALNLQLNSYR